MPENVRAGLLRSGVVPVQDQFFDIWNDDSPLIILVGSYGSGKSFAAADLYIKKCAEDPYFRCFFGRKVYGNIKGSIFDTIAEQIEALGIPGFKYSKADNSSLVIRHENGNRFSPFGADRIEKLKSIKEPTHFLLEELDQFSAEDVAMCRSRLGRTNKAKTQLIGLCNTDKVFPEHWLYPVLFGDNEMGAKLYWSYFRQNTMLPNIEEYDTILKSISLGNPDHYASIAEAKPAIRNKINAWLYINYDHTIVDFPLPVIPGNTVFLSFDFNNEPMTCTAWQMSSGIHPMDGADRFVHAVGEFEASMADSDEEVIQLLAKRVKSAFPYNPLRITGDSNGRVRQKGVPGNKSIYFLLLKYLNVHVDNLDVGTYNLPHTASRALCCTWLYNHRNIRISKVTTPKLVNDMRIARASEKVPDELVKNRKEFKLDYFDTFRYIPATYFKYFLPKQ